MLQVNTDRSIQWMHGYCLNSLNIDYSQSDVSSYILSSRYTDYRTTALGQTLISHNRKSKTMKVFFFFNEKLKNKIQEYANIHFDNKSFKTYKSPTLEKSKNYVLACVSNKSCRLFFEDLLNSAIISEPLRDQIPRILKQVQD